MKSLISSALFFCSIILIIGCEEETIYDLNEFYDAFKIDEIYLDVDRTIFFEGDDPVVFSATARDRFENPVELFDFILVLNDRDTLSGKTFLPSESGQYNVKAIGNELESNEIRIWYVKDADIQELNLTYEGYRHLTTEPYSVTGDFRLTTTINGFPVDITKSSVPIIDDIGRSFTIESPVNFPEPGTYNIKAEFNNRISESFTFEVRAAETFENVTIPLVFHVINGSLDVFEIERAVRSYNRILNNENIRLSTNELVNQWENPSWVNGHIRFELASENPQGEAFDGYRVINTGNDRIDSEQKLLDLIRENNWDPEIYINIYVSNEPYNLSFGTLPVLEGASLVGLPSLGGDGSLTSDFPPCIHNSGDFYNSNTLGQALGLYPTNECTDDYCDDTFSYSSRYKPFDGVEGALNDGGNYFIANDCNDLSEEPTIFYIKNIMDDPGVDENFADRTTGVLTDVRIREVITHDQRARMRFVIENAVNLPTPRNQ